MSRNQMLIFWATGKTGRRVVSILEQRGLTIPLSRHSEPQYDRKEASTWKKAVEGIQSEYTVQPGLGFPGAPEQATEFAHIAATVGVTKVVLASTPNYSSAFSQSMRATEDGIFKAGLSVTTLRLRRFYQNFSEDFLLPSITFGKFVFLPDRCNSVDRHRPLWRYTRPTTADPNLPTTTKAQADQQHRLIMTRYF